MNPHPHLPTGGVRYDSTGPSGTTGGLTSGLRGFVSRPPSLPAPSTPRSLGSTRGGSAPGVEGEESGSPTLYDAVDTPTPTRECRRGGKERKNVFRTPYILFSPLPLSTSLSVPLCLCLCSVPLVSLFPSTPLRPPVSLSLCLIVFVSVSLLFVLHLTPLSLFCFSLYLSSPTSLRSRPPPGRKVLSRDRGSTG